MPWRRTRPVLVSFAFIWHPPSFTRPRHFPSENTHGFSWIRSPQYAQSAYEQNARW